MNNYVFLIVLLLVVIPATLQQASHVQNLNPRLVQVGQVDGKVYYVDKTKKVSWIEAKAFCMDEALMNLATITSIAQHEFLVQQGGNTLGFGVDNWYWTGARDVGSEQQLIWDNSSAPVILYGGSFGSSAIRSAMIFYLQQIPPPTPTPWAGRFKLEPVGGEHFVLCESIL